MSNAPRVSVLTPILNGNKYLDQCIRSVLDQSYPNIEHVFVDGGSTDGTLATLADYQARYPDRIKFTSGTDRGVGSALQKAYKLSTGEIIGWIDSDDFYQPNALATAISYFQANPQAHFIYGRCNIVNATSDVIGCFVIKDFDFDEWLQVWHYIVFCATFFRRDVIETVGFVNNLGNDLSFYLRVAKRFKMYRLNQTLTNWRLHEGSISLKRAPREHKIRTDRAKEDFLLVLRYGGSICSPRALTYYAVLESNVANSILPVAKALRPLIGFSYPVLQRIDYEIRCSISVARREGRSFAYPLMKNILHVLKSSISAWYRRRTWRTS